MKTTPFIITFFCLLIVLNFSHVFADSAKIPQKILYQGRLFENSEPITGQQNFEFSIKNTNWSEEHSNVDIKDGLYTIELGSINPIPLNIFKDKNNAFIKVKVIDKNNRAILEKDISILSSVFAFKAQNAENALKLNNESAEQYKNIESINNMHGDKNENLSIIGGDNISISSTNNAITISTQEQDPTVPDNIKDGVSWNEVAGIPEGFKDGTDDGITEELDPTVPNC